MSYQIILKNQFFGQFEEYIFEKRLLSQFVIFKSYFNYGYNGSMLLSYKAGDTIMSHLIKYLSKANDRSFLT